MMPGTFENEILKNLQSLSKEQQDKALAYIKSLIRGDQNQYNLLRFAGSLDSESIREMSEAIRAGFENIDKNEW